MKPEELKAAAEKEARRAWPDKAPERIDLEAFMLVRDVLGPALRILEQAGYAPALVKARPLDEWREKDGNVLWWRFPIDEPPYVGTPLDDGQPVEVSVVAYDVDKLMRCNVGGWPGYHTHWTPIPLAALTQEGRG